MATLTEKEKQEIDNHPRRDEIYQMLSELLGTNTNITQDNIGSAFRFLSDYDEAIDWYQRALKSDPEEEQIHLGIGIVYQLQGDYKNALLHLSKAAQNIRKTFLDCYEQCFMHCILHPNSREMGWGWV